MTHFKQRPLRAGDLPPTIISDVTKAYNPEKRRFGKFWQITLKVTDDCGLRCAFCTQYVENNAVELSSDFLTDFVEYVDNRLLTCSYLLTGGEPLHHRDFQNLLKPFSNSITPFDVNSSLVASTRKIEALLSARPRTVRFSLHSTNSEGSKNFNGTNSWKIITKHAALVSNGDKRPERVEVYTHVSNTNYKSTLRRLRWIASEFNVDDINICPVYDFKPMQLNRSETESFYRDFLPEVVEFADGNNFHGLKTRALRLLGDPSKHSEAGPKYVSHNHVCHAGRSILYVDNFQDVYSCVSQQIHRANKESKRLGSIVSAADMQSILFQTPECGFDPNENDVCAKHCPLFLSLVNQYVHEC